MLATVSLCILVLARGTASHSCSAGDGSTSQGHALIQKRSALSSASDAFTPLLLTEAEVEGSIEGVAGSVGSHEPITHAHQLDVVIVEWGLTGPCTNGEFFVREIEFTRGLRVTESSVETVTKEISAAADTAYRSLKTSYGETPMKYFEDMATDPTRDKRPYTLGANPGINNCLYTPVETLEFSGGFTVVFDGVPKWWRTSDVPVRKAMRRRDGDALAYGYYFQKYNSGGGHAEFEYHRRRRDEPHRRRQYSQYHPPHHRRRSPNNHAQYLVTEAYKNGLYLKSMEGWGWARGVSGFYVFTKPDVVPNLVPIYSYRGQKDAQDLIPEGAPGIPYMPEWGWSREGIAFYAWPVGGAPEGVTSRKVFKYRYPQPGNPSGQWKLFVLENWDAERNLLYSGWIREGSHLETFEVPDAPTLVPFECEDSPPGWRDSFGDTCQAHVTNKYCTPDGGYGSGWRSSWGTFDDWKSSDGNTATTACCDCGGGKFR